MQNLIKSYVEFLSSEKGYSVNTSRAYLHDLNEFADFLVQSGIRGKKKQNKTYDFNANEVRSLMIRGYLGLLYKKNKKSTIARKLSAIRSFFRYLIKHGIIQNNPAELIHTPKQEQTIPAYLTVDDMFRLLDSIKTDNRLGLRNRAIFETLYQPEKVRKHVFLYCAHSPAPCWPIHQYKSHQHVLLPQQDLKLL